MTARPVMTALFFWMPAYPTIAREGAEQREFVRFYIAVVERICAPRIPAG
jgi:hypothetical protein